MISVAGDWILGDDGNYQYLGSRWQKGSMDEIGLFVSDAWRLRPNVTVTAGLRYELQLPFKPATSNFARLEQWTDVYGVTGVGNLFKPGTMTGREKRLGGDIGGA